MHRFYSAAPLTHAGDAAALPPDEAAHAATVLRLKAGDEIALIDGAGNAFAAELTSINKSGASAALTRRLPDNEPPLRLTVYQGLPKGDKLDLIAQKLTELGAARLVPVIMERSVARDCRVDRLSRIAREAAKQCGRARSLEALPPLKWDEALIAVASHELALFPWELARGTRLSDVRATRPEARDIALIIGPEGGVTEAEAEALSAAVRVTLGGRILRAETAAIASAAIVMSLWGDI